MPDFSYLADLSPEDGARILQDARARFPEHNGHRKATLFLHERLSSSLIIVIQEMITDGERSPTAIIAALQIGDVALGKCHGFLVKLIALLVEIEEATNK